MSVRDVPATPTRAEPGDRSDPVARRRGRPSGRRAGLPARSRSSAGGRGEQVRETACPSADPGAVVGDGEAIAASGGLGHPRHQVRVGVDQLTRSARARARDSAERRTRRRERRRSGCPGAAARRPRRSRRRSPRRPARRPGQATALKPIVTRSTASGSAPSASSTESSTASSEGRPVTPTVRPSSSRGRRTSIGSRPARPPAGVARSARSPPRQGRAHARCPGRGCRGSRTRRGPPASSFGASVDDDGSCTRRSIPASR